VSKYRRKKEKRKKKKRKRKKKKQKQKKKKRTERHADDTWTLAESFVTLCPPREISRLSGIRTQR